MTNLSFFLLIICLVQTISLVLLWRSAQRLRQHRADSSALPVASSNPSLHTTNTLLNVGQFTAGLLHDLSNPLTVISLNLESLLDSFPQHSERDPFSFELLTHMQHAVTQMEHYLHAARSQIRGKDEKVWFEPATEIDQIFLLLRHRAKHCHVELEFNCDTFDMLLGSPAQFAHLVTNLVMNAIDAYENQPANAARIVYLTIASTAREFSLTVQDRGAGISPEILPYIFEPFFTTKAPEKGSGLGLTIIKDIVEKHFHGSIAVDSKPNQGTTFVIIFSKNQKRRAS